MTDRYDVAVVGAGPAGSAAALAACRAGARVLLLDRADFPRDKPCGDGIAADAVDILAGLGVSGVTAGYRSVANLRLIAPGGAQVSRPLPRPAYTIPRRVFDARLVAAAVAAGAELRNHTVRTMDDDVLRGAAVVIGADGAARSSGVRWVTRSTPTATWPSPSGVTRRRPTPSNSS